MSLRSWAWSPTALALLFAASVLALGSAEPDRYALLLQEDAHVEWMTVWGFVLAAALFARAAAIGSQANARLPLVALALLSLLVAGEEVSWGQRLLSFQPPELFLRSNYQQEANVHNLLKGIFDSRWQVFTVAVGYGAIATVAAQREWLPRSWAPALAVVPALLVVAALELTYPLTLTGELAEALLALAFVHDATVRLWGDSRRGSLRACLGMAGALTLGASTPAFLDRTLYAPDGLTTDQAKRDLDALGEHLRAHMSRGMFGGRRVHKRFYTAIQAGYLAPKTSPPPSGDDLRWRYSLDPWQQPYWLLHMPGPRGQNEVLLYSFGPNRRRDTWLKGMPEAMSGDDIAIRFTLAR